MTKKDFHVVICPIRALQRINFVRCNTCIMINTIKKNIKTILKEQNKSVKKFCAEHGVNRNYINQITENTPVSKIVTLARWLGTTASDLVTEK